MQSIVESVSHWAVSKPHSVAVQSAQAELSYEQLNHLSDNVAQNLRANNIAPGDVVALCMPRVIDVWPIIFGIFKAGAVYLPVDPSWPQQRLASVLQQASCRKVVVAAVTADKITAGALLAADLISQPPHSKNSPESCHENSPENTHKNSTGKKAELAVNELAYIIFTSGSTGQPKGVKISHHSLWHLLTTMRDCLSLDASLRQLCITSFAFDLVIPDLFLPLLVGGCCVLDEGATTSSPQSLANKITQQKINLLQATPSTLKAINDTGWQGCPQLQLLVGGDKVSLSLAATLSQKVKALWHCYGPTEATVWAAINQYDERQGLSFASPLPGYGFYVVDEHGECLTQAGAKGELLITGQGLAQGYVGADDLTAEKFIQLSVAGAEHRAYKTGDIFQYTENMSLSYVGRADNQIKLSGHRVELGEIEAVAESVIGVERFIAEVVEGQLTGFYLASNNQATIEESIKAALVAKLPWYMLPTQYIAVTTLPLTHNQKVNRPALHKMAVAQLKQNTNVNPSPTPNPDTRPAIAIERASYYLQQVSLAWGDIFDENINAEANIFSRGMDSLSVVSLLVAIEQRLHINLPMSFIYSHTSLAQIAEALEHDQELAHKKQGAGSTLTESGPQLITLQQGEGTPLICIHPVGGGVFHYNLLAGYLGKGIPVYGVQAQGYDGGEPLYDVVLMAQCYAALIKQCFNAGAVRLLGGSMGGVLAVETAKQLTAQNIQVETVYLLDAVGNVANGQGELRSVTARAIVRGLKLRLADKWMQLNAKVIFIRGKRISNLWRYQYLTLTNHLALNKYLASAHYCKKYAGNVVLFRLPLQKEGGYADKYLGWGEVITPPPQVHYAEGSHQRFLESDGFAASFKEHF
ncbi:amino acid adenylation domain-containing protein [Dasania marina]|uniref:amino acid adenylation domain-containing protein n=1 Tax=Dasania marina TaxID=471499 RepID=UPI000369D31B|nr:amino acid adenylation domain-containing protein [Dasania marina]